MLYLDVIKWISGRCILFAFISVLAMAMFLAYAFLLPILSQAVDQANSVEHLYS